MKYYKEIHGDLLIRMLDSGEMQRFDRQQKQWVEDQSMAQIFYGGIIANELSESEMAEYTK